MINCQAVLNRPGRYVRTHTGRSVLWDQYDNDFSLKSLRETENRTLILL